MTGETAHTPNLPGTRLRQQRERRGLTLAQAGSELHLDQRLLAALEADNYDALGAPIFVKGHLRNYARLLGLDAAEIVAEYERAQQPSDPTLVAHKPDGPRMDQHQSQAWVGWFGWVFLLVLGLLLAGWWYYQQEGGNAFVISDSADRLVLPQDEPGTQGAADTTTETPLEGPLAEPRTDSGAGGSAQPPDATTVPAETATADTAQALQQSQAPVQEPPRPATRSTASAGERGLALEFTEESWVEIYDAEGRPVLYDLLGPGTRREINATGQLRVFLGNASGVNVYLGGERFEHARYRRNDNTARFVVNVPSN